MWGYQDGAPCLGYICRMIKNNTIIFRVYKSFYHKLHSTLPLSNITQVSLRVNINTTSLPTPTQASSFTRTHYHTHTVLKAHTSKRTQFHMHALFHARTFTRIQFYNYALPHPCNFTLTHVPADALSRAYSFISMHSKRMQFHTHTFPRTHFHTHTVLKVRTSISMQFHKHALHTRALSHTRRHATSSFFLTFYSVIGRNKSRKSKYKRRNSSIQTTHSM